MQCGSHASPAVSLVVLVMIFAMSGEFCTGGANIASPRSERLCGPQWSKQ